VIYNNNKVILLSKINYIEALVNTLLTIQNILQIETENIQGSSQLKESFRF